MCSCVLIHIEAKPININTIEVNTPTEEKSLEELEKWYKDKLPKYIRKEKDTIFMRDMGAKIVKRTVNRVTGEYGLSTRNEREDRFG